MHEDSEQLARDLLMDEEIADVDFAKVVGKGSTGQVTSIVVIANGETARELLKVVETFEAQLHTGVALVQGLA